MERIGMHLFQKYFFFFQNFESEVFSVEKFLIERTRVLIKLFSNYLIKIHLLFQLLIKSS